MVFLWNLRRPRVLGFIFSNWHFNIFIDLKVSQMFITQKNFPITSMLMILYPISIYLVDLLLVLVPPFPMETEISEKHSLHFKLCLCQRNTLNVAALETWEAVGTAELYHEKRHDYKVSLQVCQKTAESSHISGRQWKQLHPKTFICSSSGQTPGVAGLTAACTKGVAPLQHDGFAVQTLSEHQVSRRGHCYTSEVWLRLAKIKTLEGP